ncbi:MAG: 50S ribosomal protein L35 [Candidatus Omnitrophica bacterium]|nr:50S ribosomal protein L35 [Candidatus Omnitrophota bacterium]
MPKLKTNKSFAKRARLTKSGKIKRHKAGKGHILTKKNANRKRRLRKTSLISGPDTKLARRLLPYG